jgi:chromosome transmission fidelity protein 18
MVLKVRKAACFGSGSLTTDVFVEPPKQKFRAVYKFNEGSSSAVRKPIKMSALM